MKKLRRYRPYLVTLVQDPVPEGQKPKEPRVHYVEALSPKNAAARTAKRLCPYQSFHEEVSVQLLVNGQSVTSGWKREPRVYYVSFEKHLEAVSKK